MVHLLELVFFFLMMKREREKKKDFTNFIVFNNVLFGEDFHCKDFACLTEFDLHDFSEASFADKFEKLEILDANSRLEDCWMKFHKSLI